MDQMGQESGLANTSRDNACVNGHPGLCYIERCCGVVPRVLDPDYKQDGALVRGSPYIKMVSGGMGGRITGIPMTTLMDFIVSFLSLSKHRCVCTKLGI